jgi:hypothetical protein
MATKTQTDRILAYLKRGKPLTGLDALKKFDCFRLPARIHDLIREGHDIRKRTVEKNGKYVKAYWLA